MADLKTNLLGFTMNSPIIGASGTVGYGVEYEELADFSKIGGISGKGLTLHGQYGNKGERLWETPSGLISRRSNRPLCSLRVMSVVPHSSVQMILQMPRDPETKTT